MIYSENNINKTYADCSTCNAPCYKLIDCNATWPTVATTNLIFEAYIGKTIKWIDNGAVTPTERCATVDRYVCRKESYPMPNGGPFLDEPLLTEGFTEITIIDCFETCASCQYITPDIIISEPIYGRNIEPGYDVTDCGPLNT